MNTAHKSKEKQFFDIHNLKLVNDTWLIERKCNGSLGRFNKDRIPVKTWHRHTYKGVVCYDHAHVTMVTDQQKMAFNLKSFDAF